MPWTVLRCTMISRYIVNAIIFETNRLPLVTTSVPVWKNVSTFESQKKNPFPYVVAPCRARSARDDHLPPKVETRRLFTSNIFATVIGSPFTLFSFRVRYEAPIKTKRRSNDTTPKEGRGYIAVR